ncbi:MAG TPA: hypothetical protein VFV50_00045 [Bdellovibrionales bacterium]|nr:hypothetical protein [Bdellovibrionales bacterium]
MRTLAAGIVIVCGSFLPSAAEGWARRGHDMVAQAASYNLGALNWGLRERSFDLEYYSNVPDMVWKADDTIYQAERVEHFVNLEIFQRETGGKKIPFDPDRKAFFEKFPKIQPAAGRAYWRVSELAEDLARVTKELRASDLSDKKKHHDLQARWFLIAGILSHYVGDLSMPLHVSENYDGQLTNQKGIHRHFEGDSVDQIFPEIASEVMRRTKAQWAAFHAKNKNKTVFNLMVDLGQDSFAKKEELLELDKTKGRDLKRASSQYKVLILDRLTKSSLYLSEIWVRNLDWKFDSDKFFHFSPKPEWLPPRIAVFQATPPAAPDQKSEQK